MLRIRGESSIPTAKAAMHKFEMSCKYVTRSETTVSDDVLESCP